jgi:hypothetical protein
MKVAIYLDSARDTDLMLASKCIASVREHMPKAEIWHLTDMNGPAVREADHELRVSVEGAFCYRRFYVQSLVDGETLFIDVDTILKGDVSHVFDDKDFDAAVTTDIAPGDPSIVYNSGVTFSRSQHFWREQAEAMVGIPFEDWKAAEGTFTEVARRTSLKVKELPGEVYNRVPTTKDDVDGLILHYRGKRKRWLIGLAEIGVDVNFVVGLNTDVSVMRDQARANMRRGLPQFTPKTEAVKESAVIVGGGPSLNDTVADLQALKRNGAHIFALNNTHDWLIERGIVPDFHVLLDARPENAEFVRKPHPDVTYLVAAQCHPSVYEALAGHRIVQWTAWMPGADQLSNEIDPKLAFVGGGNTVGLKAMTLTTFSGYKDLHLFGFDSSYRDGQNHAYPQPLNANEERMDVTVGGRTFHCARWMARQAMLFQHQLNELIRLGVNVTVYGDGMLQWMTRRMSEKAAA